MDGNGEIAFGCIRVIIIISISRRRIVLFFLLLLLMPVVGLGSRLDGSSVSAIIAFAGLDGIIAII